MNNAGKVSKILVWKKKAHTVFHHTSCFAWEILVKHNSFPDSFMVDQ